MKFVIFLFLAWFFSHVSFGDIPEAQIQAEIQIGLQSEELYIDPSEAPYELHDHLLESADIEEVELNPTDEKQFFVTEDQSQKADLFDDLREEEGNLPELINREPAIGDGQDPAMDVMLDE
jgi:hypothetical protein